MGRVGKILLNVVRRRGGVFHLWGHSWELEQTAQWQRLDAVLRLLGELRRDALRDKWGTAANV